MNELREVRIRRVLHDVFDGESPSPEAVSQFRAALRSDARRVGRRAGWTPRRSWAQPPLAAAVALVVVAAVVGLTLRIHVGTTNHGGTPSVTAPASPAPPTLPPEARLARPEAVAVAPDGSIYVANTDRGTIVSLAPDGRFQAVYRLGVPAGAQPPNSPIALAFDRAGRLYVAELGVGGGRAALGSGTVTIDPATLIPVTASGFAFDTSGAAYVSTSAVCWNAVCPGASTFALLVKVAPGGAITGVSGLGGPGRSGPPGDHGPATAARLSAPRGLALDAAGDLFIADSDDNRVRRITPDGVITTVAGTGTAGFSGDGGPAAGAELSSPDDVAVDSAGNLYIADAANNRVREVRPDGTITTVAGTGAAGYAGDGGAAIGAHLTAPNGIALDASGDLYIADTGNDHLRRVARASGVITTVL